MNAQFDRKKALKQNEFAGESFEKMALELAELQRKCVEKNIPDKSCLRDAKVPERGICQIKLFSIFTDRDMWGR